MRFPAQRPTTVCIAAASSRVLLSTPRIRIIIRLRGRTATTLSMQTVGKTYNKKEIGITSYNITGIKYVPVKVSSSDFADFCKQYTVTKNGETLQGGYSEFNLNAYTAVAAVDKDTNGLKEVTLGSNGYTFGARQTGEGSGIKGEALKTADKAITAAAKEYSGNFGEMLRVDLNNNYGDLGGHMQTVVWKYYGTDEKNTTRSPPTVRNSQLTTGCTRPWAFSSA